MGKIESIIPSEETVEQAMPSRFQAAVTAGALLMITGCVAVAEADCDGMTEPAERSFMSQPMQENWMNCSTAEEDTSE